MEEEKKNKILLVLQILAMVLRVFAQGGKTKLGLYLLAVTGISIKFVAGIDIPVAEEVPGDLPLAAKAGAVSGGVLMAVGILHDLLKKADAITKEFHALRK